MSIVLFERKPHGLFIIGLFLIFLHTLYFEKCSADAYTTNRQKNVNVKGTNIIKVNSSSVVITNNILISDNVNRNTKRLDILLKTSKEVSSGVKNKKVGQSGNDNVGKKIVNKNLKLKPGVFFKELNPKINIKNTNGILKSKQIDKKILNKNLKLQPYVFFKDLLPIKNATKVDKFLNNYPKSVNSKNTPKINKNKNPKVQTSKIQPKQQQQGKVKILQHNLSKKIPQIKITKNLDKTRKTKKKIIDKPKGKNFEDRLGQQVEGADETPPPDNEKPNGGPPTENETPGGGPPPDNEKPNGGGLPTENDKPNEETPPPNNPPQETPNDGLPPDAEVIPPTDKTTEKPTDQPVTKPVDKPTEAPPGGDKPNDNPSDKPDDKPGSKPDIPEDKPPGDKDGEKPVDKPPGDKEGENPVDKDKPNETSTTKPQVTPTVTPATNKSDDKPTKVPPGDDKPNTNPDDKPSDKPNVNPTKNPNDKPNGNPDIPDEKSTTPKPGDKLPGDKEGEKPVDKDKTNETSTMKPQVTPTLTPAINKSDDKPTKEPPGGDKPNTKPDDKPSDKPNSNPDEKPTSTPKPKDKDGEKPLGDGKPNETSTAKPTKAPVTKMPTGPKPNTPTNNGNTTEVPKKEGPVPPKVPEVSNTTQGTPPAVTEKTPSVVPPPGKPQGVIPPGNSNVGPNGAPSPKVNDTETSTGETPAEKPETTVKPTVKPSSDPEVTTVKPMSTTTQIATPPPTPPPTQPPTPPPTQPPTPPPTQPPTRPPTQPPTTPPTQPPTQPPVVVLTPTPTTQRPAAPLTKPADVPEANNPQVPAPTPARPTTAAPTIPPEEIQFVFWNWEVFGTYFTFTGVVIIILMLRVVFRSIHFLSSRIPEPCLMIGLGALVVFVLKLNRFSLQEDPGEITGDVMPKQINEAGTAAKQQAPTQAPSTTVAPTKEPPPIGKFSMPPFTPELYFLVLVPPTVLEAAYTLHDSAFLDNIYPILMLSVICKIASMFTIAYLLVFVNASGYMGSLAAFGDPITTNYSLTLTDSLLFTSVLTGVDASPVLDILEDAAVNKDLFYILLGESLLNDAVTTTMYSTVNNLASKDLNRNQHLYLQTVFYFFYVSLGGMSIGATGGIVTSILTRFTGGFRLVEPLLLICCAYLAYIVAEMIGVSGQTCIIACGLVQAHYAFKNISSTSNLTVRYFIKIISSTSDSIIFVFLGLGTLSDITDWQTWFFLWSLGSTFFLRCIVVFVLIGLYNLFSYRYIPARDQIIISYCGIRGSVCYCLMHMINGDDVGPRELFSTTMILIIIWTALVQGGTMKYLIEVLDIERDKMKTMNEEVHENIFSVMMNGIETISKVHQESIFSRFFKWVDRNIFMRILVNKNLREASALRELSEKLQQDYSRKPVWMIPVPKTPVKNEKRAESPHVKWDLDPQTQLNNKAPFSIREQPWLPGIPPDQEPRNEPWSIRETPWLPGIPTNRQAQHEPFSIKEQPWLPGIPLDLPRRRRRRQALPHNLSDTLRDAMRNTPFQRMQYHNDRRAVEDSFQNAPPLDTSSDALPHMNLRRGQVLLEMQEVAGRLQQPVTSGDLRRRLFVAQMCMPQRRRRSQEPGNAQQNIGRRRSQEQGNSQQTPAAAAEATPQRRPSNNK